MKTINADAMAAIEAGTAIVTGAVELTPTLPVPMIGGKLHGYSSGGFAADHMHGAVYTVPYNGTLHTMHAYGGPTGSSTGNYRFVIYEATDADHWGLKLGETATATGIPINAKVNLPLLAPIAVTVGQKIALCIHTGPGSPRIGYGPNAAAASRDFTDLFSDGAAADYSALTKNGNDAYAPAIWVTGTADGLVPGAAPPIRVWGGYGPLTIDGEVYQGIGNRGMAQQTAGAIGGVAQGLTLSLSGIDAELLALLDDTDEFRAASVVVHRLIFAGDGKTLLDASVFDRGRIDTISSEETVGGDAVINAAIESAARGLGRSGVRQRSDADQRLIDSSDSYFKATAYAGEKTLYWGGKKPSTVNG